MSIREPSVALWYAVRAAPLVLALSATAGAVEPSWKPIEGQMMTRWAKQVTPKTVLPEYPRPMMVRDQWLNLNGLWQFATGPKGETTVWVNGREATRHRGGYDPFSVDITEMLKKSGPQEIVVRVWDPTDKGLQARGKQKIEPEGFMYTPASGIWQTVWIEPVPASHIRSLRVEPDVDELDRKVAEKLGVRNGQGVLIKEVDPDGIAASAGIRRGNLILQVGNKKVASVAEFKAAVKGESLEEGILLVIRTANGKQWLVLQSS